MRERIMEYKSVKDRVSIILPVYNAERYLEDVLDDLLSQSYKNIEIIVIDDGSTDRSWEIITKYKQDTRIKAFQFVNGGVSKARNTGLGYAQGEYIRFVDADDRVPRESIERMIEAYKQNQDIDLVIGNYTYESDKSFFTGDIFKEGIVKQNEFIKDFIRYVKTFYFGVPWNKLYKREIIEKEKIRFFEDVLWCEDFLFNVEYYRKCIMIYRVNVKGGVYHYFQREGSITSSLLARTEEEIQEIETLRYTKASELCAQCGMEEEFRLEWKYYELYATLSDYAKKKKYKEFCRLLETKEVETYIKQKRTDLDMKVWKYIKKSVNKKSYLGLFLFFVLKGETVKLLSVSMPRLLREIHSRFPKRI